MIPFDRAGDIEGLRVAWPRSRGHGPAWDDRTAVADRMPTTSVGMAPYAVH